MLLLVVDGLGDCQLAHPSAEVLRRSRRAVLRAPFPTTTTVGLSSVAISHGVIDGHGWERSAGDQTVAGGADKWERVNYDTTGFLPAPNLWERLNTAGVRAVISHPVIFEDSPFSNMVYRGAERYGYSSLYGIRPSELLDDAGATLMVVYLSSVDSNAHMSGQRSLGYKRALEDTGRLWGRLARTLPPDTALIGTADHGHCDIPADGNWKHKTGQASY